jgi:uncharacterized protein (TIGR03083 family)
VQITEHLDALSREGDLLAAAVARGGPDAPVPTCPEWTMTDLVHHTGGVHRWAHAQVAGARSTPLGRDETRALFAAVPAREDLEKWFREGHAQLLDALRTAPPELDCWYFFAAPSALAFWSRRQAHETAVHRVDAESAAGTELSPVSVPFALDGIDELTTGFHTRSHSRVRSEEPRVLRLHATDADGAGADWYLHLSPEPLRVERESPATPDCTVSGPARHLYLGLWNRADLTALDVEGDASLVELWRERSAIVM